ncbi:(E)-4-hydroxy-3-methylbut-2-enyl-diphosphate synthase [Halocola ammonii]
MNQVEQKTKISDKQYCNSLSSYSRFKTREVMVGDVGFGGDNPIRVQSMTTADTKDTEATVAESIRMIDAGCELVRITAPSRKDAENLGPIKEELRKRGYETPLVADIHFTPNAAEIAARIVEKVRVNPGNYADKKKFQQIEYTDEEYLGEIERIRQKFEPLVKICKEEGTAMRIGTNHGSLSDRIMSRYGDTPLGMVESAMEFIRICRDNDFHDLIISMKASNPQVMVQAYRLLVHTMMKEGMNYPLHLGVTEAGEGEDGRIKSAVGIGTLLEDGLGDTIRVSLTEASEKEIPVAKALADRYEKRPRQTKLPEPQTIPIDPFVFEKRDSRQVMNIGGSEVPRIVADFSRKEKITPASFFPIGYNYSVPLDKWNIADMACDMVFLGDKLPDFELPGTLLAVANYPTWKDHQNRDRVFPLLTLEEYLGSGDRSEKMNLVELSYAGLTDTLVSTLKSDPTVVVVLKNDTDHGMAEQRLAFFRFIEEECEVPVIIKRSYEDITEEHLQLYASTDMGALLIDGMGDGIWIDTEIHPKKVNALSFGILQATRTRISKTEYISCPSCGRTLFDLQETTAMIRKRTDHLKGVKIGIMGCIVNGPGEMADADYGYVGTGPGKITLYKEKEVVKKNVPSADAVDELINLIKEYGDWIEP